MKIYTQNFGGNVHEAATRINELDLAKWLVEIKTSHNGTLAIGVFKVPDDLYEDLM